MNTDNGALEFEAYINNSRLNATAAEAERRIKGLSSSVVAESEKMDDAFSKIGASVGAYFGVQALASFGREVVNVRGEFQQLGIAFEVMLGSKEKADRMMAEQITFAAKTPYTLTEVATNTKQLMAMGVATEDVMKTMKSLGNVSAGVSVPISRVAINYGQVMTLGKLQGREIRDFAMAGIPIIDELAKMLGKTKAEILDMSEAGQISAQMTTEAFARMSGEGGKFFNMMERQNASVTGQVSNLQDKIAVMMNDIGTANEGLIYSLISGTATAVEHYDDILKALLPIVATYGAYRAALILAAAAQKAAALGTFIQEYIVMARALGFATANQIAFNRAVLANPYALAVAAIAGLIAAIYVLSDAERNLTETEKAKQAVHEKAGKQYDEQKAKITSLVGVLNNEKVALDQRKQALSEIQKIIPNYHASLDNEGKLINNNRQAIDDYLKSLEKQIYLQATMDEKIELTKKKRELEKKVAEKEANAKSAEAAASVTVVGAGGITGIDGRGMLASQARGFANSAKRELQDVEKAITALDDEYVKISNTAESTDGSISKAIIKNKTYWEEQKKAAQAARDAMPDTAKGSDEWKKQTAIIDEATRHLQAYSDKQKAGKESKDPVKEELDKKKELYQQYYNWLNSKDEILQKAAKTEFSGLLKEGTNYLDYLKKQRDAILNSGKPLSGTDNKKLATINNAIAGETDRTVVGDFKESLSQQLSSATSVLDALAKIQEKRKELKNDGSDVDKQKKEALDQAEKEQKEKGVQEEKKKMEDLLENYKTTKQQMMDADKQYQKDIEMLDKALLNAKTDEEKAQIADSIAARKAAFNKSKDDFNVSNFINTEDWKTLFGNLDNMAVSGMIELRDRLEEAWSTLNLPPDQLNAIRDKINELNKKITEKNPFAGIKDAFKRADSAKTPEERSAALGEAFDGIAKSSDEMNKSLQGGLDALANLGVKGTEELKQIASDINAIAQGAANLAKGIASGNPLQIITGSIDLLSAGINLVTGIHDRKIDRAIKKHAANVESLQIAYDELGRAIDKALGSAEYKNQKDAIDNLKKQREEYNAMIQGERDKKKTDDGKIKEYEDKIREIGYTIEDTVNGMREDLLGGTVKDIAGQLGDAMIDAFAAGEDAAAAWGKKVDDVVGDVIRKMLIQKLIEEPVGNIMNKYMAQWVDADGNFLGFDAVMNSASKMGDELSALGPGFSEMMSKLPEDLKKYFTGDSTGSKSALSGAVKGVSEETASILSGYINAVRINQIEGIQVMRGQLLALDRISSYTFNLIEILSVLKTIQNNNSLRASGL